MAGANARDAPLAHRAAVHDRCVARSIAYVGPLACSKSLHDTAVGVLAARDGRAIATARMTQDCAPELGSGAGLANSRERSFEGCDRLFEHCDRTVEHRDRLLG